MIQGWAMRALSLETLFQEYVELVNNPKDPVATVSDALSDPATWSALREVSETIASLRPRVIDIDTGMDLGDHPLLMLLRGNAAMTGFNMLETQLIHLLLTGNSYSEIEYGRLGFPIGLWPIRPELVGEIKIGSFGRLFNIDGVDYGEDTIFHIMGMSWTGFKGESVLRHQGREIQLGIEAARYGRRFYKTGRPFTILETENANLTKKQAENLSKAFVDAVAGDDASGVVVTPKGVKHTPQTATPDEGQFIESRKLHVRETARIFKTPPTKIADDTAATYNNVQQENIAYVRDSIEPLLERMSAAYGRVFLDERQRLVFSTDKLLEGTRQEKSAMLISLAAAGIIDNNEARAELGYAPREETDGGQSTPMDVNMGSGGQSEGEGGESGITDAN